MRDYVEYVKDFIIDNLPNYEGTEVYMCDLGYTVTEEINANGTATFSTYEAKEYIKEWWDEASDVYEYQKMNYGEVLQNPFENPEAFMVCMIIEGVNSLLSGCEIVDDNWNDKVELTEEIIDNIIEYVKTVEKINF